MRFFVFPHDRQTVYCSWRASFKQFIFLRRSKANIKCERMNVSEKKFLDCWTRAPGKWKVFPSLPWNRRLVLKIFQLHSSGSEHSPRHLCKNSNEFLMVLWLFWTSCPEMCHAKILICNCFSPLCKPVAELKHRADVIDILKSPYHKI